MVNDLDREAQVFRNETDVESEDGWLIVELHGPEGNREGVGAVVRVRRGETVMSRLVRSGTSYLSQDEMRQHFGLGGGLGGGLAAAGPVTVEVDWPDGARSVVAGVPAGNVARVYYPEG